MNVRVAGVLRRNDAVLTLKYHYPEGDVYALPGGGVEADESCEAALLREFREEVRLDVAFGSLLYTGDMMASAKRKRTLHLIFTVDCDEQQQPRLDAAETTANTLVWLPQADLGKVMLYPDVGKALDRDLREGIRPRHLGDCMQRKWA